MYDATFIQKLKQNNVSKDAQKTLERVYALWKSASKMQKSEVERLSGVARVSVARVYKTGNISAKLAVSIAQTLNVDPYYLVGLADESGECTDELLKSFLIKCGYEKLLSNPTKSKKRRGKDAETEFQEIPLTQEVSEGQEDWEASEQDEVQSEAPDQDSAIVKDDASVSTCECEEAACDGECECAAIGEMTEEDMTLLMRAVLLRAKLGSTEAIKAVAQLKKALLS